MALWTAFLQVNTVLLSMNVVTSVEVAVLLEIILIPEMLDMEVLWTMKIPDMLVRKIQGAEVKFASPKKCSNTVDSQIQSALHSYRVLTSTSAP